MPLLDTTQLQAGHEARKQYLAALIRSFQDYGLVRLTNHSIAATTRVRQIFDLSSYLIHSDESIYLSPHEFRPKPYRIADGKMTDVERYLVAFGQGTVM
nr:hypothetical protein CFP56_13504 [Quercus suber]